MNRDIFHFLRLIHQKVKDLMVSSKGFKGQSYIELALVIPVLLIMILGVVEVSIFVGRYLDILDLTREAARFASVRDPFDTGSPSDMNCSTASLFNFFYDTSCIFSPPADRSDMCTDSAFCNGVNPYLVYEPATDDVVVSVFTVTNNQVSNIWPSPSGYWALSNNDGDSAHSDNWRTDCHDNIVLDNPHYTTEAINVAMSSGSTTAKGFIAVEFFYCYQQVLNLPIFTAFVPNPVRIHAYTIMPLPAAQPSPTPIP